MRPTFAFVARAFVVPQHFSHLKDLRDPLFALSSALSLPAGRADIRRGGPKAAQLEA